jgi:hypothetical protein
VCGTIGNTELDRDESIILETRNIKFKSVSFDALLTNRRIILTDSKKNATQGQDIALSTIRNVEAGENAIRDHFLVLSIVTETGEKQRTVLTFVRQAGGERKRECREWAKELKGLIPQVDWKAPPADSPKSSGESPIKGETQVPVQGSATTTRPTKKKIETALPLGKITEKTPVAPIPKETSSLPTGSFCSRCGNRVPFKSTFCNRCGTPIQQPYERTSVSKPVISREPDHSPAPLSPVTRVTVPPQAVQPVVIETQVQVPPSAGSTDDHKGSQIEQIIHTIEPLIEDSVPRTQQSTSPVQKQNYPQKTETAVPEPAAPAPQETHISQVQWPVLPNSESPVVSTQESPVTEPTPPPQQPVPGPTGKKPNYLAIAILIIAILPILAGLVIVANIMSVPSAGPAPSTPVTTLVTTQPTPPPPTPTPVVTSTTTPGPTPLMIPPSGVWVRAAYPGSFIALIGTPGNQIEVSGTGDTFYPISTNDGIVVAALQKKDGSGDKITLEVYKNGVMLRRESTVTPKGIVEVQLDLKSFPAVSNSTSSK